MRLQRLAIFLLLSFHHTAVFGQENNLQLTAGITGQRYCTVNASVDALQLTLQLRYTNTGSRKLILYKGNRLFFQIFISRGGEEAAARKNELRTTHSRYFDEQPEKIAASSAGQRLHHSLSRSFIRNQTNHLAACGARWQGTFQCLDTCGRACPERGGFNMVRIQKTGGDLRERWRITRLFVD